MIGFSAFRTSEQKNAWVHIFFDVKLILFINLVLFFLFFFFALGYIAGLFEVCFMWDVIDLSDWKDAFKDKQVPNCETLS